MEAVFRDVIRADRGRTVLLSSHILSEVEHLCDRVSIIREGRTVETGTLAELRHLTRSQVVAELAAPPPGDLAGHPGVHDLVVEDHPGGHRLTASVDDARLGEVLGLLTPLGLRSLSSTPPTLEELFLRHYDGSAEG